MNRKGNEAPVEVTPETVVDMLGAPAHPDGEVTRLAGRPGVAVGMRENRTYRLSGGRRPAPAGRASSDPTPGKPGNAGGGKGPQVDSDGEREQAHGSGRRPSTPEMSRNAGRHHMHKRRGRPERSLSPGRQQA